MQDGKTVELVKSKWTRGSTWMKELAHAKRSLDRSKVEGARAVVQRVYDEAILERASHRLGTAERGACTQVIAKALKLLRKAR